jgi:hypothetical protein
LRSSKAGDPEQTDRRTECLIDASQLMLAIQPLGEPQAPPLYHAPSECALKVGMVCGVASIAERNQIRRFIDATSSPRNQVMNVGFALGTRFAASSANV